MPINDCILCKQSLLNYDIIHKTIRGDTLNSCIIVKCNNCSHIQLVNYKYDLHTHYINDSQDNEIKSTFNKNQDDIMTAYYQVAINRIHRLEHEYNINITKDTFILDFGSGVQIFPLLIYNKYKCNVHSIEISKPRSDLGLKYFNDLSNGLPNINYKIFNVYLNSLFVKNHEIKYDVITIWHVLEHVDNIHELINNLFTLLKPNGKLIIETPNEDDILLKHSEKYRNIMYQIHHISYFTKHSYEYLFNMLNITNFKIYYTHRYDIQNFLGWIIDTPIKSSAGDITTTDSNLNSFWLTNLKNKGYTDSIIAIITKN